MAVKSSNTPLLIISGIAKVWNGTTTDSRHKKKKEVVPFTGEVTKYGIKIKITGKEYATLTKVKIKEGVSSRDRGGHHHRGDDSR